MPSEKSEQIYRTLHQDVITLPPGSRMPAVRTMMKQYGASQLLIDRAVHRLTEEGLLRRRPDGLHTRIRPGAEGNMVGYTTVNWHAHVFSEQLDQLRRIAKPRGCGIMYFQYDFTAPFHSIKYPATLKGVLVSCAQRFHADDLYALERSPIPVVLLNYPYRDLDVNFVSTIPYEGGLAAARHLVQHDHRKLALLYCQPHTRLFEERAQGFLDTAELLGAQVDLIDMKLRDGDSGSERSYPFMLEYLRRKRPGFTALYTLNDLSARNAMLALTHSGFRVPEDISVLGSEGIAAGKDFLPPLTAVGVDMNAYMNIALDTLEAAIAEPERHFQTIIRHQIIERSSVLQLNPRRIP